MILLLICLTDSASNAIASDFYWAESKWKHHETTWHDMPFLDRVGMLSQDGIFIWMEGEIKAGDFAELMKIHSLVPIHTLIISSPGGSVSEAFKIAEFVDQSLIRVETDSFCEDHADKRYCGCASACALIWLSAPVRGGSDVKIYRPYFDSSEFQKLPDGVAMQKYEDLKAKVQFLLQSRGYSPEFIAVLFRIPREQAKQLTSSERSALPINASLDELLSARCYGENEQRLREFSTHISQVKGLEEQESALRGHEEWLATWKKLNRFREETKKLEKIYSEFNECKLKERIQASLRKSGKRLSFELSAKLTEFNNLLEWFESSGPVEAFKARYLKDHDWGTEAAGELKEKGERLRKLGGELHQELPLAYNQYLDADPMFLGKLNVGPKGIDNIEADR